MKINKNIIKELSDYLDEFNLTEIEYTEKDLKVKVSKTKGISSSPVITNTTKQKMNEWTIDSKYTVKEEASNFRVLTQMP